MTKKPKTFDGKMDNVIAGLIYHANMDIQAGKVRPLIAWNAIRGILRKEFGSGITDGPPQTTQMGHEAAMALGREGA